MSRRVSIQEDASGILLLSLKILVAGASVSLVFWRPSIHENQRRRIPGIVWELLVGSCFLLSVILVAAVDATLALLVCLVALCWITASTPLVAPRTFPSPDGPTAMAPVPSALPQQPRTLPRHRVTVSRSRSGSGSGSPTHPARSDISSPPLAFNLGTEGHSTDVA